MHIKNFEANWNRNTTKWSSSFFCICCRSHWLSLDREVCFNWLNTCMSACSERRILALSVRSFPIIQSFRHTLVIGRSISLVIICTLAIFHLKISCDEGECWYTLLLITDLRSSDAFVRSSKCEIYTLSVTIVLWMQSSNRTSATRSLEKKKTVNWSMTLLYKTLI